MHRVRESEAQPAHCRSGIEGVRRDWRQGLIVGLLLVSVAFGAPCANAVGDPKSPSPVATSPGDSGAKGVDSTYLLRTPQLDNPLRPLANLPSNAQVELHAAVATVPDPVETHLARSFDMVVAALLNSFQAKGFALDGFAFTWKQSFKTAASSSSAATPAHRLYPSLLLFRKEAWRSSEAHVQGDEYYLMFLVGESPIFGVHPLAFQAAARCAMRFNGARGTVQGITQSMGERGGCDQLQVGIGEARLDVIAPTFSGSMQSLAMALAGLCGSASCTDLQNPPEVVLLSPSATAPSNARIEQHPLLGAKTTDAVDGVGLPGMNVKYVPLASDLAHQIVGLLDYLCSDGLPNNMVILTEESTFGRAVLDIVNHDLEGIIEKTPKLRKCFYGDDQGDAQADIRGRLLEMISTAQFSPNINAIRAEHSRRDKASQAEVTKAIPARSRLLEFNLDEVEPGIDRPPVYQPGLSSRSDELMLYRMFDSLRTRRKPEVVAIVATDVRDRLFLLSEVRKSLPSALPVVFEMDYLLVHPDYRATSRGALVVPTGNQQVCLSVDDDSLVECRGRAGGRTGNNMDSASGRVAKRRFAFATDFAANTFRAASLLAQCRDSAFSSCMSGFVKTSGGQSPGPNPGLYVATLGGFSRLGAPKDGFKCAMTRWGIGRFGLDNDDDCKAPGVGSLAAADTRIAAQVPTYLVLVALSGFFVLVPVWLWLGKNEARTMLPFVRHIVFDAGWLREMIRRRDRMDYEGKKWLTATREPAWLLAMLVAAVLSLGLAILRLWSVGGEESRDYMLAHGRDPTALVCLFLIYVCVALVGLMRMNIVDRRHRDILEAIEEGGTEASAWNGPRLAWLLPLAIALGALLAYTRQESTRSVDPTGPWLLMVLVLGMGAAFLIHLGRQMRTLSRMTLRLSCCIRRARKICKNNTWPGPSSINQPAQTPFNLCLGRKRDLPGLQARAPEAWASDTKRLINGAQTELSTSTDKFQVWQALLVSEMKLAGTAIRTSAWCAMLAPIMVLIALSLYPPIQPRLLSSLSILLLAASFVTTVFIVLRLETDSMMGPMFTRDGDHLTVGGSLRALWPKLLAMGVILIPLVVPDIWNLVYSMIRSVNSFG